jgi:hypothetical protein
MHLSMSGSTWLNVIGAAVLGWLFGAVYYGALGRVWLNAQGRTVAQMQAANAHKSAAAKVFPFVLSLLLEIVMAAVMSGVLTHMGMLTLRGGLISGFLIWLGFVLTTTWANNAYPGRSTLLTAIDAGHWLGVLLIIGAVLGGLA